MSFRINAKHFAITYSNTEAQNWVEFNIENLCEHLISLGAEHVIVSKELHESGDTHFHALVSYKRRKDVRSATYFDFNNVHPNIQACRNINAWTTYIKKDGNFIEQGTVKDDVFQLCRESSREDWVSHCLTNKISFQYMDHIWESTHIPDVNTISEFEKPEGAHLAFELEHFRFENFKSQVLCIVGPTGCGKTTWALLYAPKPALIVTHFDSLRQFRPGYHQSLIFDDMNFTHQPREAQIQLTDQHVPRTIHCRYKAVTLPSGVPKIFTANVQPFTEDPAINRRIFYKILN